MEAACLVLTLLPSCAVPRGKEFPAQSSGCRKEHPSPVALWGGAGLLRKFTDALSWFWMSKCIAMFLLIMLYYYFLVYRQMVTETLLVILVTFHQSPNNFLSKARLDFGCLQGKPQLLELGLPKDWCSQGFPVMGIAPEPHWWEPEILGDWEVVPKRKETRFWTYCSVLVIIHILFLEPGWSGFLYSRNPVFNYCCACVGYLFSCISSEEVHFW